jgi:ABC-2 type transport system permease protein
MGVWLLVFMALAGITGWWIGFISAGIVLRYGPKVQTVIWTLPGILLPFSAIYFPLDRLPGAAQAIAQLLPTTYIFESMRALLSGGTVPMENMLISLCLNAIYLALALWFFVRSFYYSKNLGLGRFD